MSNNGFGGLTNYLITPNPEDRQYELSLFYHLGNNPNDSVTGVSFLLPPGALITGGSVYLITGGGGTITVTDNQASPVSLFGTIQAGAGQVNGTTITAAGSGYTSGATVAFSAAPAGGVTATGTVTVVSGDVTGIVLTNPGSGYTSAPTVTITAVGAGSGATATATIQAIATPGFTQITNYAYYPTGATLTVPASNSQAMIRVNYVVDGRANEVFGQDV
jgi:hypothetical protein